MGVKHRYIDRRDWKRPLERICRGKAMPDGAYAFRTDLVRLSAPGYGQLGGTEKWRIADDGWCWLGWMRPDFPWALTAMRDENGKWVQFYFDIVSDMGCDADGRAWFEDCYLDIVLLPDGQVFLLDEDELAEALEKGEAAPEEAQKAREAAAELMRTLPEGVGRLEAFVQRLYDSFGGEGTDISANG